MEAHERVYSPTWDFQMKVTKELALDMGTNIHNWSPGSRAKDFPPEEIPYVE
jgi:hypothetical protein